MPLTRANIANDIATALGISNADVERLLDGFISALISSLIQRKRIELREFGAFDVVESKPMKARDTYNNKPINLPARLSIKFRPSKILTQRLRDFHAMEITFDKSPSP